MKLAGFKALISFRQVAGIVRGALLVVGSLPGSPLSPRHRQMALPEEQPDLAALQEQVSRAVEQQSREIPKANLQEQSVPANTASRAWHIGKIGLNLLVDNSFNLISSKFGRDRKVLSEKSAEYLANELCKMRGAPLKLAQMLSIQEDKLIPAEVRQAFEIARSRAYSMPAKELVYMLTKELGDQWRSKFSHFEDKPFAAASIGQVHFGRVGEEDVAVKVQYRGVKESIQNDFWALTKLLGATNALPKQLFASKLFASVLKQLLQECDYVKEAELQQSYRDQLKGYPQFVVPKVYPISTGKVLVSQFLRGRSLQQCEQLGQEQRDRVGGLLMKLTLLQIFKLKAMQSDPNPSNYLFDLRGRLLCMDFGATHHYNTEFKVLYRELIRAGIRQDRAEILRLSKEVGFLTGEQNDLMNSTHVQSILTLAAPFRTEVYDFGQQTLTQEIYKNIPVMLKNRLKSPPEEIYSLHRKFSGTFLQCMRLGSRVGCRRILRDL